MLRVLRDQGGDYVEVTGDLDLGRSDRLDAPQGQGRRQDDDLDRRECRTGQQ